MQAAPEQSGANAPVPSRRRNLGSLLGRYTIQWILLAFVVVLFLTSENFGTWNNLANVLRQASFVGIAAAGMTLLIILGAFDLSVASLLAVTAIVGSKVLAVAGPGPAVLAALTAGAVLGIVNGLIVTRLGVPAFVATLGMMYAYLGLAFIITNDNVQIISDARYLRLGAGEFLGLPVPFLVMLASFGVCYVVLAHTPYGRFIRAIGSNPRASHAAAIPVARVTVVAFALVGVFTALSGVLLSAQLSSVNGTVATGFELSVIAVVVIGGTSLNGGSGTLLGTFTGALFFAVLNNALNLYGVGSYWQYVATGAVLVSALGVEGVRSRLLGTQR